MPSSIQTVEDEIAGHKQAIAVGNSLARLMRNADFRKVILDGYLEKEAVRLVHARSQLLADAPHLLALNQVGIEAVSLFNEYLRFIREEADRASRALPEAEQTREELASNPDE